MNKNRIRLTESTLSKIVKESVDQVLTELDWRTADSAMIGAANDMFTPSDSHNEKRKRQHDLFLKKRLEYMMQQYDLTKEQVLFTIRTNEKDFENMTKLFRDYNKYFADDNFSEYDNGKWQ